MRDDLNRGGSIALAGARKSKEVSAGQRVGGCCIQLAHLVDARHL
jgi:hypothetical protein